MTSGTGVRTVAPMDNDVANIKLWEGSALWARAFARLYDPLLWAGERAGLRDLRRDLLREARGIAVELGGGTGLNLALYPDDVEELVVVEPDAAMRDRLEKRARRANAR